MIRSWELDMRSLLPRESVNESEELSTLSEPQRQRHAISGIDSRIANDYITLLDTQSETSFAKIGPRT